MANGRGPKEWAWSYSRLKNYETCPKRHHEIDVLKNYTEESEALTWGNEVHKAMADALSGKAPLPEAYRRYQPYVDEMASADLPGELVVEQKYAITRNFRPTTYFAPDVWYRGVCDAARIAPQVALARDWKTGKVVHDSIQLMLMATCIFAHFPSVLRVRTQFVWLKDDAITEDTWTRPTIAQEWAAILPRVTQMEDAYKTLRFPPRPDRLCRKWCPVTSCPFHGK